jgi:hypothetical protein
MPHTPLGIVCLARYCRKDIENFGYKILTQSVDKKVKVDGVIAPCLGAIQLTCTGGVDVKLHAFLTSALERGFVISFMFQLPLLYGNEIWYSLDRSLVRSAANMNVVTKTKIILLVGSESWPSSLYLE